MNPATLIPTPDAIPVPWGWFYILLMLTFLLHILVMNAMLGGGIIALISSFRGGEQNTLLSKEFGYKWPYTIAFAVNMGVAPLLFVQVLYGQFIYSSSILMAVWWFSIFGLLILAYYAAYIYDFKFEALGSLRIFVLEFSVLILLFVGFLFSNNMTLMLQPEKWQAYFTGGSGTLLNLSDPSLIPRYLHFVVGSVAVAGLFLALVGHYRFTKSSVDRDALISKGMGYFTYATVIQIFIGIWFLIALPKNIMMVFMGGSGYGTILLLIGIVLAFAALYFGYKQQVAMASVITLITLVIMIFMRDLVRIAYLKPYFQLSDLTVQPEYSPMIFFLVVFAIGLALIGYMLKLAFGCRKEVTK
ncbi:MAG: hypothetical protein OQK50_05830 [Deltaproteobacteria bacterium]|nr:hypothetical protein [Deltaproteobacteria bacterium]